jgi:putative tricarboxylic transport membrane protein
MKSIRNLRHVMFVVAIMATILAVILLGGCAPAPAPTQAPAAPTQPPAAPTQPPAPPAAPTQAPTAAPTTAPTQAPTAAPTAAPTTASVQPDVAFYNGKTVTFIVATKAGGGYDTYARLVAPYVQKYLPGSTVIIKNVPGAGHIIGANEDYAAKPDGLTIATFNTALIYSQIVGAQGIQFDLAKFTWIAKLASDNRVLMVGTKTPFQTFDDALKASQTTPIVLSSAGVSSASNIDALLLQRATGLQVKMIAGYSGNDSELAILRGEVQGEVGSYSSLQSYVTNGDGRIILQIGMKKEPSLLNVPLLSDIVTPDKKPIADLILTDASLGRLVAAPPGVPEARRQALIQAFQKATADPDFLAAADKAKLPIDPAFGDDVGNLIKSALNQSPTDLTDLKSILGPALSGN